MNNEFDVIIIGAGHAGVRGGIGGGANGLSHSGDHAGFQQDRASAV